MALPDLELIPACWAGKGSPVDAAFVPSAWPPHAVHFEVHRPGFRGPMPSLPAGSATVEGGSPAILAHHPQPELHLAVLDIKLLPTGADQGCPVHPSLLPPWIRISSHVVKYSVLRIMAHEHQIRSHTFADGKSIEVCTVLTPHSSKLFDGTEVCWLSPCPHGDANRREVLCGD